MSAIGVKAAGICVMGVRKMSEISDKDDRSAQVAHVLHGVRPAEPGEDSCVTCGTLICSICAYDEQWCARCYNAEYMEREAEREEARVEWEARERARQEYADDEEKQWWKTFKI